MADAWLQQKYINLMSNTLGQFKRKTDKLYNCRCPECGDSKKNKFKARGYILFHNGNYFYKCHNCGYSAAFEFFLQKHGPMLYKEYMLEKLKGDGATEKIVEAKPKSVYGVGPLKKLKKISQLQPYHTAVKFIRGRAIPNPYHADLRYTDNFSEWTNSIIPDKLPKAKMDRRILIPLLDERNNMFGFQGRALSGDSMRYITIMLNNDMPKVFGLHKINKKEHVYAFEGPFDSMFVNNSLAACGSDIVQVLDQLSWIDRDKVTIVYDNEPRSDIITKKLNNAIDKGYKVFIWPASIKSKDMNDHIIEGQLKENIQMLIDNNTYQGLSAKMALSAYRK